MTFRGRSRPGPALRIDAFLKIFNQKPLTFRSPAAPDPARLSKSRARAREGRVGSAGRVAPNSPNDVSPRSAIQQYGICAGGPSKSGPVIWEFTPTKLFRSYFTICFLPSDRPPIQYVYISIYLFMCMYVYIYIYIYIHI